MFRTAKRLVIETVLVANQRLQTPPGNPLVSAVWVDGGADVADQYIAAHASPGDLVVTQDVPLAALLVPRDVAVLDPPRSGAGREVIDLLAAAGVPRVVHIGCEAASFARDIGLYLGHGYAVEQLKVYDAFPLTHHVECVALLTR